MPYDPENLSAALVDALRELKPSLAAVVEHGDHEVWAESDGSVGYCLSFPTEGSLYKTASRSENMVTCCHALEAMLGKKVTFMVGLTQVH